MVSCWYVISTLHHSFHLWVRVFIQLTIPFFRRHFIGTNFNELNNNDNNKWHNVASKVSTQKLFDRSVSCWFHAIFTARFHTATHHIWQYIVHTYLLSFIHSAMFHSDSQWFYQIQPLKIQRTLCCGAFTRQKHVYIYQVIFLLHMLTRSLSIQKCDNRSYISDNLYRHSVRLSVPKKTMQAKWKGWKKKHNTTISSAAAHAANHQ